MASDKIIVVGAGVVGLSTAFALASRGATVTLVDPFPGRGASYVAAGMIAPVTEASYGEESLVGFSLTAASQWPKFAAEIAKHTALDCGLERSGTLFVAVDHNDRAQIRSLIPLYNQLGLRATWHQSREVRGLEPLLSPTVRGGFEAPDDFQVDNRRFVSALTDALSNLGVQVLRDRVRSVTRDRERATGVLTESRTLVAGHVVVCAGYNTEAIGGLPHVDRPHLRPVKGQILRLYQSDTRLRLRHSVRAVVAGSAVYLVPRASGQVVVGATVEEQGATHEATAGAVYGLLRDAIMVVPSIAEAELQSVDVGLRPATSDNAPIIGPSSLKGLIYALGHYRHGVLLSPITATCIADLILEGSIAECIKPFLPGRFHHDNEPYSDGPSTGRPSPDVTEASDG